MKTLSAVALIALLICGAFAGGWFARGDGPDRWEYRTTDAANGQSVILPPCDRITAAETMANGYDGCLTPYSPPD